VPFSNSTLRCNITLITVWLDTANPKHQKEPKKKDHWGGFKGTSNGKQQQQQQQK